MENFVPRPIGNNWIVCFVCGSMKNGFSELDPKTNEPTGEQIPSVLKEDGIHYKGGYYSCQADMASYVDSKETGERVKKMFEDDSSRVFLDYRNFEPNYVQLKIGACDKHLPNLEHLRELVIEAKGITPEIIQKAKTQIQI